MSDTDQGTLASLFKAVGDVLRENREALNQADLINGNHGDHMVQVFDIAAQAASEKRDTELAEAMEHAARLLEAQAGNGSAQLYAHGLQQIAQQFRRNDLTLDDFLGFVRAALAEDKVNNRAPSERRGDMLKALLAGLANWVQIESGRPTSDHPLDINALFEFGAAYLQAKQRGGSRSEILADAAANASPLGKSPHRRQSGKLAIQALLQAMQSSPANRST